MWSFGILYYRKTPKISDARPKKFAVIILKYIQKGFSTQEWEH